MKKIIVFAIIVCFALALSFATGSKESGSAKTYSIHLVTMDSIDQHWQRCFVGAQYAAEENGGVTVVLNSPDVKDDYKQIESINNSVARGADLILIAANSPDAPVAALNEASQAGVKILSIDSPVNFDVPRLIATDNEGGGRIAGERLLQELNARGIKDGKIGIIGVNQATQSTQDRERGFYSAFEGTNFTFVGPQYCDGDASRAKEIADNYISQGCIAIFGSNEGCTAGAGNAAKEAKAAGIDILACGFDASDTILQLVREGALLCVIGQNSYRMGYLAVKEAIDYLNGVDMGGYKYIDSGVNLIELANVDQF